MKRRGFLLATLSTFAAILAAVATYASRLTRGEGVADWWVEWVQSKRGLVYTLLLGSTILVAAIDWGRAYLEGRHQTKFVMEKVLNDLSKALFQDRARNNRITLFKETSGWRVLLWNFLRLPKFSQGHKWQALWRINPRGRYLGAYLRPPDSRGGRRMTAAFRVSDDPTECEGMAGLIWDRAGQEMVWDLPKLNRPEVRALTCNAAMKASDKIGEYAERANVTDFRVLRACDNYARHFYGTLIRKSDGSPWGVLLLDSLEHKCPFLTDDGKLLESFAQRFDDYARVIGKIAG